MPAFFFSHHPAQPLNGLWNGHVLNIGLPTLTMQLSSSLLHVLKNILFCNLQNLPLDIVSDNCPLLFIIYRFVVSFVFVATWLSLLQYIASSGHVSWTSCVELKPEPPIAPAFTLAFRHKSAQRELKISRVARELRLARIIAKFDYRGICTHSFSSHYC